MISYKSTLFWTLVYISATLVQPNTGHDHQDHSKDFDSLEGPPESTLFNSPMEPSTEEIFSEIEASFYVNLIFQKFGQNDVMTFEGFEHFLSSVGLGDLVFKDHDIHDHIQEGKQFRNLHETHSHKDMESSDPDAQVSRIQIVTDEEHHHHNHHGHHQENDHSSETKTATNDTHKHNKSSDSQTIHEKNRQRTEGSMDPRTIHEKNRQRTEGSMDQSRQIADYEEERGDGNKKGRVRKNKKGRKKKRKKLNVDMGTGDKMDRHTIGDEQEIDDAETNSGIRHKDYEHGSQFPGSQLNQSSSHDNQNSHARNARAVAVEQHPHDHSDFNGNCPSPIQFLSIFKVQDKNAISKDDFLHMCSAILYHIEMRSCSITPISCLEHTDWHEHCQQFHVADDQNKKKADWSDDWEEEHYHGDDSHHHDGSHSDDEDEDGFLDISGKVWGFALASVTLISLVGLVCVAVVPIMDKLMYNHLIQFLVALAIGTLTGDALLHLIPHAMVPHSATSNASHGDDDFSHGSEGEGHEDHSEAVWRGMAVLGGFYFFLSERLLAIVKRKKTQAELKKKEALLRLAELDILNPKYTSCHEIKDEDESQVEKEISLTIPDDYATDINKLSEKDEHHSHQDDQPDHSHEHHETHHDLSKGQGHTHGHNHSECEGHHHGHSHEAPGSVSSVAWMVIMGDGLHNFSDGLAIGAAFANSITVGLSTSIAVFCHELPHELGDFAVLLKAGMSVKHALLYNIVSSVLCYLGMVIGVAVGNIEEASSWIFLVTAGIFIYISLVDMLPEITHDGEDNCCHLMVQILGISTGVAIMLIIALFEHRIKVG